MKVNKLKPVEIALIGFIIFLIVILSHVLNNYNGKSELCLNDPLVYGARGLEKANNAPVMCSCTLQKPNSPTLRFNGNSSSVERPFVDVSDMPNYTLLFEKAFNSKN